MKKIILFLVLLLLPFSAYALSADYKDVITDTLKMDVNSEKVNIYLFHRDSCPHCQNEIEALKVIKSQYEDYIDIHYFELDNNSQNRKYYEIVKNELGVKAGVPLTVIGDGYYIGFSDTIKDQIVQDIVAYTSLEKKDENVFSLPLVGKVSVKEFSLPIIAIILGFVDGFNPCAMWVLLFLINILIGLKDKKRMMLIGFTFLFISGLVYFLAMLGISTVLTLSTVNVIRVLIGAVALIAGVLNLRTYIKTRKDNGCHVVDDTKRKKIFERINRFVHEKSLLLALVGVAVLAISVNFVELACSLGFPTIFSEILAINNITGIGKIIYLLLYTVFYMIDDMFIFVIAVSTLSITGLSTKYNKLLNLIGGIIMIVMGILLIIKPEWIMFNF